MAPFFCRPAFVLSRSPPLAAAGRHGPPPRSRTGPLYRSNAHSRRCRCHPRQCSCCSPSRCPSVITAVASPSTRRYLFSGCFSRPACAARRDSLPRAGQRNRSFLTAPSSSLPRSHTSKQAAACSTNWSPKVTIGHHPPPPCLLRPFLCSPPPRPPPLPKDCRFAAGAAFFHPCTSCERPRASARQQVDLGPRVTVPVPAPAPTQASGRSVHLRKERDDRRPLLAAPAINLQRPSTAAQRVCLLLEATRAHKTRAAVRFAVVVHCGRRTAAAARKTTLPESLGPHSTIEIHTPTRPCPPLFHRRRHTHPARTRLLKQQGVT